MDCLQHNALAFQLLFRGEATFEVETLAVRKVIVVLGSDHHTGSLDEPSLLGLYNRNR